MKPGNLRVKFIALWAVVQTLKILLAGFLPLLVDESFYAWEGRHLAWAYSDLPGLTAWLARLGTEAAGQNAWGLRAPFLLLGAAIPWLVVDVSRRWFGAGPGYVAGMLAVLMPLSGLLGVLAVPDVPLVFSALLCLSGISRLREKFDARGWLTLTLGLVFGALSHYRFALVLVAGLAGLLLDPWGRALIRDPRMWAALVLGALAWGPLLAWNVSNEAAGLRFQVLERNPWMFNIEALAWLPVQALLVTPLLFVLLLACLRHAWRHRLQTLGEPWGLVFGVGSVSVLGYFVLGFIADTERVSFHWPLAGWLVLATVAPAVLSTWTRIARQALFAVAAVGLLGGLSFLFVTALPAGRAALADTRFYPGDFAGWTELGAALSAHRRVGFVVAGNFQVAAQLAFALGTDEIPVLDDALNHKHGRAAQLRQWRIQFASLADAPDLPLLLVIDDTATPMKHRLAGYHRLCETFGALPPAEVINVDHGSRRFLLFRFHSRDRRAGCSTPALAWMDAPAAGDTVPMQFVVRGWAFKDGVGLSRVEVLLDGAAVATADYGAPMPEVASYWRISSDPQQPRVGFSAHVDARGLGQGAHWIGLRLHGTDGSIETWPAQRVRIAGP